MEARMIQTTRQSHRNKSINLTYGCDKDNNTYSYRMINGSKIFRREQLGLGWQNQKFTPNCEIMEGDGEMGRPKAERPSDEALREFAEKNNYRNLANKGKVKFGTSYGTLQGWLIEAGIINEFGTAILAREPENNEAQTPPEPPATNQAAQDVGGSAETIIPEREAILKSVTDCKNWQKKISESDEGSRFNPETPEPQRKTYTTTQYEADMKAGTRPLTTEMLDEIADDRRSALSIYCEKSAVESLRQGWAAEVFSNINLSREKKLELIGLLLDMGAA